MPLGHERGEGVVDPADDGLAGAEVGGERDQPAVGAVAVLGRQEQGDVGAAEPVDGLLRVADDEQVAGGDRDLVPRQRAGVVGPGVGGGDAHGDLDLDRIGVLELVEQEALVAAVQALADGGVLADELAGEHEQVVERELAGLAPGVGGVEREARAGRRRCAWRRPGRPRP